MAKKVNLMMDAMCVTIDGVEYINQRRAIKVSGMTDPTFKKRVAQFGIEKIVRPNGRILYKRADIENALQNGWFNKYGI